MDIEGFIGMGFSEGDRQQMTVTPHTVAFIFVAADFRTFKSLCISNII